MRARERRCDAELGAHEIEAVLLPDLDRLQPVDRLTQPADARKRVVDRREGEQRDDDVLGARHQSEPRRGHDGKRSLAAAQQAAEVVAGVVLLEPVEPFDDIAVGEHRLHADHLVPRRAVPQHVYPTRVGRDVAADRRAVARPQIDAVLPAGRARVRLHSRQRRARAGGHLRRARVDRSEGVEAPQGEDDLAMQRNRPADESRVATLRHDRDARRVANAQHGRDFGHGARSHDGGRSTLEPPGPVDGVAPGDIGIGEHVIATHHGAQLVEQRRRDSRPRREATRDARETWTWVSSRPRPGADDCWSRHRRSPIRTSTAP